MRFTISLSAFKGLSEGSSADDQRICKIVCYGFGGIDHCLPGDLCEQRVCMACSSLMFTRCRHYLFQSVS